MSKSPVTITVQVQPKSSSDEIAGVHDGRLKVRISAPPVEGKANERLREVLAKAFDVSKSSIEIIKGKTSKIKTIKISGIDSNDYDRLISKYSRANLS
ncbi:MAG: DUF167 domain-containing protein [Thermodesulfobacteriota bacterium]